MNDPNNAQNGIVLDANEIELLGLVRGMTLAQQGMIWEIARRAELLPFITDLIMKAAGEQSGQQ